MDIFEKASKKKLRFTTGKGEVTVEDLWDMSLQSLNNIAKAVNKKLKEEAEEDFIKTESTTSRVATELTLKLEILKHIISFRLEASRQAQLRQDKKTQVEFLKALVDKKRMDKLEALSLEDIEAQLKTMEEGEEGEV